MGRSVHSSDPLLGIAGGWSPADNRPSYSSPVPVLVTSVAPFTSDAINLAANSMEILASFDSLSTVCSVDLLADDGSGNFLAVASFNGLSLTNNSGLIYGRWPQGKTLGGGAIKVRVNTLTPGGTVTIRAIRLN